MSTDRVWLIERKDGPAVFEDLTFAPKQSKPVLFIRADAVREIANKAKCMAKTMCDPANGSAIAQAAGAAYGTIADQLLALLAEP